VLEINSMASLGAGGTFVMAARAAGYTFESLMSRMLDITHERYFGVPLPPSTCSADWHIEDLIHEELAAPVPQ
jgi:hypothetical protein